MTEGNLTLGKGPKALHLHIKAYNTEVFAEVLPRHPPDMMALGELVCSLAEVDVVTIERIPQ